MKDAKDLNEVELYFAIDECGSFIWHMNHDMADGRIPEKDHAAIDEDIVRMRKLQVECIEQLPKFGISALDENCRATDAYWVWYRKWNAWHKGMSDEAWRAVNASLKSGVTDDLVAKYRQEAGFDVAQ